MGSTTKTITRTDEGRQSLQLGLVLEPEPQSKPARVPDRAPLARSSDPLSSHLAAENFTRSGRRANQKRELLAWLRGQSMALTSAEIARDSGMDRHGVARRLPDLERDGTVVRCGMRECGVNGGPALTWRAS